ncbi:MAG TPA: YciI family protein [Telmatospirillum sp.]|nr:YciI family protein [Telmatospirillum sp.]
MFIVTLRYKALPTEIEQALPDHRDWLIKNYADGVFLLSGPQKPHTGGVILAHGLTRDELDARLAEDPFNKGELADYDVVELLPRGADPRLAFLVTE